MPEGHPTRLLVRNAFGLCCWPLRCLHALQWSRPRSNHCASTARGQTHPCNTVVSFTIFFVPLVCGLCLIRSWIAARIFCFFRSRNPRATSGDQPFISASDVRALYGRLPARQECKRQQRTQRAMQADTISATSVPWTGRSSEPPKQKSKKPIPMPNPTIAFQAATNHQLKSPCW